MSFLNKNLKHQSKRRPLKITRNSPTLKKKTAENCYEPFSNPAIKKFSIFPVRIKRIYMYHSVRENLSDTLFGLIYHYYFRSSSSTVYSTSWTAGNDWSICWMGKQSCRHLSEGGFFKSLESWWISPPRWYLNNLTPFLCSFRNILIRIVMTKKLKSSRDSFFWSGLSLATKWCVN